MANTKKSTNQARKAGKLVAAKVNLVTEDIENISKKLDNVISKKKQIPVKETPQVQVVSKNGSVGEGHITQLPERSVSTSEVHLPSRLGPREIVTTSPRGLRVEGQANKKVFVTWPRSLHKKLKGPKPVYEDAIIVENNPTSKITDWFKKKNIGTKKLYTTGVLGAMGLGTYSILSEKDKEELEKETPSLYKYDPINGWQEYNNQTGQYENQLIGFGVDRFGNTNYYDGQNWLTPDLYILGSNGYIYNKRTGLYIGTVDDMMDARINGYDNVFDYRAAKAGYTSPEAVKQLQTQLGITADGKWGLLTLNAFKKYVASNWGKLYDPSNLFTIYLNSMLYKH